jgi:ribonuclease R
MPERYVEAILKYLAGRDYQPLKTRQVARQLGIPEDDYGTFREAVKQLRDAGRIVLGDSSALTLPPIPATVVGFFRSNPKGFGFVLPETPYAHSDLYVPPESTGGAMTGDLVKACVQRRPKSQGRTLYAGKIVEIITRGQNRFVGTLNRADGTWFVLPDGRGMTMPIVVRDVSSAGPVAGAKVVVEIVEYPAAGDLPVGVIVETLGQGGAVAVETLSVIRAHGLVDEFPPEALTDARRAVDGFDPRAADGREDLTGQTVITIDPPDARDFDDAISLTRDGRGTVTLGVHIADVSHFVRTSGPLDAEARRRATSVYFPRKVLPMLPEMLSNGVCSLQEGQRRYCLSVFITYDAEANVVASRIAQTVISSTKRLTYKQAQSACDGDGAGCQRSVVELMGELAALARRIEARRRRAGMLHLDLPEVELVFDAREQLIDVEPADDSYTHTMIEMFMVEANEAIARMLDGRNLPFLRRVHPAPDPAGAKHLATFIRACGHKISRDLTRQDMQELLEAVRGRPESYAVNLALLKSLQQAEYSPMHIGHFALGSNHYCHFTSPIRRYPDLTVHRLVRQCCRRQAASALEEAPADVDLAELGEHCTAAERRAEAAEGEIRDVLVLQFLADKVGEVLDGVITGVANVGIFVQSQRYLVDGLVRLADLGDDWWDVSARYGQIRGERTGKTYRIGDLIRVRIAAVDVARRQLDLLPEQVNLEDDRPDRPTGRKKAKSASGNRGRRRKR